MIPDSSVKLEQKTSSLREICLRKLDPRQMDGLMLALTMSIRSDLED
jgi:hypothetical protein